MGRSVRVQATTEVTQSVADDEIWSAENHVIARNLVEDRGRDFYRRSLVFNNYKGGGVVAAPHYSVTAALLTVEFHANFIGHQRGRIA